MPINAGAQVWYIDHPLAEQTAAVDPSGPGNSLGHLTFDELRQVDAALRLLLDR